MSCEDLFLAVMLFGTDMAFIGHFIDPWLPASTNRALQPARSPPCMLKTPLKRSCSLLFGNIEARKELGCTLHAKPPLSKEWPVTVVEGFG